MKSMCFNWTDSGEPVRLCISDTLTALLPHSQKETELMFFYRTEGCRYLCNGKELLCSSNDMLAVNPGELHSCSNWGRDCVAACVMINVDALSVPMLKNMNYPNKVRDEKIIECFGRLRALAEDETLNECGKRCGIYGIVYDILAALSNYSKPVLNGSVRNDINEILSYIDANVSEDITPERLAEKIHLSKSRFYHIFKDCTGLTPVGYILKQRIKKACEILKSSDMSIQEIADECNFCTSSYFSKKFSEYMQVSPSEFRKNARSREHISLQS